MNPAFGAEEPIEQTNDQSSLANTLNPACGAVEPNEQTTGKSSLTILVTMACGAAEPNENQAPNAPGIVSHDVRFPCRWSCGRTFKSMSGEGRQKSFCKNHESKKKCDICDKVFTRKFTADLHRLTHLPHEKRRELQCPHCKMQCTTIRSILNHNSRHEKGISYQCNQCNQKFCYQHHLTRHTTSLHSSEHTTQ